MELEQILDFFGERWNEIVSTSKSKGIKNGFYPIVIPDAEDNRYINGTLAPTGIDLVKLVRARIVNPPPLQFSGILVSQSEDQKLGDGTSLSTVTYVREGEVYQVQCLRERFEGFSAERHTVIGEPKKINHEEIKPEIVEDLQKTYMDISSSL